MAAAAETMLLTIFLRHDQSNDLAAIQTRLKAANWWDAFPPEGVEIVSWTVAMSKNPGRTGITTIVAKRIASSTTSHVVGAVSMNTQSTPAICAEPQTIDATGSALQR